MKAHRDMMCDLGEAGEFKYTITDPNNKVIYEKFFSSGERGNSNVEYSKEREKPKNYIMKNGFKLITDESGEIITNEELLTILSDFRYINRTKIPVFITNNALVSLATYKPKSKEEFISLPWLGEKLYEKCGELFMVEIKKFENSQEILANVYND